MRIPGFQMVPDAGELDGLPWRATRYEGVEWLDLAHDHAASDTKHPGASNASESSREGEPDSQTVLIRMAPGCGYPRHRHVGPEDVLVLSGGYRDEDGRAFEAGQFVRYPAGSEHSPVAIGSVGAPGEPCILFAVAHQGTVLASPDKGPAPLPSPKPLV